jgi:Domain of unknown function (DUF5103)
MYFKMLLKCSSGRMDSISTYFSKRGYFSKKYCFLYFVLLSLFVPFASRAQSNADSLRYDDWVYKDYIRSVQIHQIGWKFSPPLIALHSGDLLQLDFDDLAGDYIDYYYTLVHCDADWKPSDMVPFDYLSGYSQDEITNYSYSFNTLQKYTHYRLVFPNANMQVLLSGNYLLKVYKDNNPDSLVFTRKIMVYENQISIQGSEKRGIGDGLFTKQEIIFNINTQRANIIDPFHALQILISQNGRWDNAISGIQPAYVQGTSLIYDMDFGNSFDGGNQFRSFDMTSLKYLTDHEDAFVSNKDSYEINLRRDDPRAGLDYFTFSDLAGQFLIYDKDDDSTPINSQYVYMNFYLPMDSEVTAGNIYIFGAFTDWKCQPDYQMHYESHKHGYIGSAYLKQGYYEYEYAYLPKGSKVADLTFIEGSHSETTNTYYIYAYYRPMGLFYDKLIGFATVHAPTN